METPEPSQPPATQTKKWGFRFSILTILLVTAIVGLTLAYFQVQWQLADRNAQLKQIRRDYQLLEVNDKSKIYVLPLKVPGDNMWQWRVHLPEGSEYHIKSNYDSIPPKNPIPKTRSSLTLPPGTYVITQMFVFDPSGQLPRWRFHLAASSPYANAHAGGSVYRNEVAWLEAEGLPSGEFTLPGESDDQPGRIVRFKINPDPRGTMSPAVAVQAGYDADQKVELLRWEVLDAVDPAGQEPVDYLPLEVFRLWIEREPLPTVSGNVIPCPLVRNDRQGHALRQLITTGSSHPGKVLPSVPVSETPGSR